MYPINLNAAFCSTYHLWNTPAVLHAPIELTTNFDQRYIGIWDVTARHDVQQVRATLAIGFIDYTDYCASLLGYNAGDLQLVWGNATLTEPDDQHVHYLVDHQAGVVDADYLLHFGNHVDATDAFVAGIPAYTNIIWTLMRDPTP